MVKFRLRRVRDGVRDGRSRAVDWVGRELGCGIKVMVRVTVGTELERVLGLVLDMRV